MRHAKLTALVVSLMAAALYLTLISPTASACSLAQKPDWLDFVLSHGLANLNPDCTLTWKSGEVTDLNGNLVGPLPYAFLQQYGVIFFFAGLILAVVGFYLAIRSRSLNAKSQRTSSIG
jgi:hypothetical protein